MDQTPSVPVQRSTGSAVTARLDLWSVVCPGFRLHAPACLRYDPTDPYTVCMDNYTDRDETITWLFARELLATGLSERVGTGDVTVFPGAGDTRAVFILLRGEGSAALLQAEEEDIRTFVQRTECLVPIGSESDHVDLDALLLRLPESPPADRG